MKEEGNWLVKGQNSAKDLLLVAILYLLGPVLSRRNGYSILRQNHRPCPRTPLHPLLLHLLQGNPAKGTSFYCNVTRHTPSSRCCWHPLKKKFTETIKPSTYSRLMFSMFSLSLSLRTGTGVSVFFKAFSS